MQEGLASVIMVSHSSSFLYSEAFDLMIFLHRCIVGNHLPTLMNLCMIV